MTEEILVVIVAMREVRLLIAEVMEANWSVVREVMLNDMMVFAWVLAVLSLPMLSVSRV